MPIVTLILVLLSALVGWTLGSMHEKTLRAASVCTSPRHTVRIVPLSLCISEEIRLNFANE